MSCGFTSHSTQKNKRGHFGDDPQANPLAWYEKTKPNATKARIHQSKEMYNTKKLKPGLVASYDIWPGNGEEHEK